MFRSLFRKKYKQSVASPLFSKLAKAIDKRQRVWAAYLANKTEGFSSRSKKMALFTFCFLFGGTSIYVAIQATNNGKNKIHIENISVPSYTTYDDSLGLPDHIPILSESQYQRIKVFKNYMDSLQISIPGKAKYDSIIKARPGLMDSIFFIEKKLREFKTK